MVNKKMDLVLNKLILLFIFIGVPLCVTGVAILAFSGLFGSQQMVGTSLALSGVIITSLTFPLLAIKLIKNDAPRDNEE